MSPEAETRPEIEYTQGDNGTLTFQPSGHQYEISQANYRRQKIVLIDAAGRIAHLDTFDLTSDLARERFLKGARAALNGSADLARRELRMIAANIETILPEQPRMSASHEDAMPYTITDRGIYYERYVPNAPAPIETHIANFGAKITADILVNDGTEERREYELDVWQGELRRTVKTTAKAFPTLTWLEAIGSSAVVFPGAKHSEHALAAIQLTSRPERRLVFGHTGWRQLEDGSMGFLTAAGALTGDGLREEISVHLEPPLNDYRFPAPPDGPARVAAVQALLDLLDVADRAVTIPLLCTLARSVFGPADFVLFLKASTGSGKTVLAGLVQSCFGPAFTGDHLPANFSSTGNAVEVMANLAKDCVLVVDDFQRNNPEADRIAERIGRAVGNQAGRARLTREAQLRSQRPPRGTMVMTGEDAPKGESLRARLSIVELPPGGMRWPAVSVAQQRGADGVHAAGMAAFIQWVAAAHDERMATFRERFETIRATFHTEHSAHPKTNTTAANLMAAFTLFTDFLQALGWPEPETLALERAVEQELRAMIDAQAHHLTAVNPITQFMDALESALTSGKAHIASRHGEVPNDAIRWGWQEVSVSDGKEWRSKGARIGWEAKGEGGIYLDWGAAFHLVQREAVAVGNGLQLGEATMLRRLDERGLLLSRDDKRQTLKIRRQLQGANRNVVHLRFPMDDMGVDDDANE